MSSLHEAAAVRYPVEPWAAPEEASLVRLVRRCLAVDGGLPVAAEPWFVQSRWLKAGSRVFVVRAEGEPVAGASAADEEWASSGVPTSGAVVAAVAVRDGDSGPMVVGLVDPVVRDLGIGGRLLDAALSHAADRPATESGAGAVTGRTVTLESEGLSAGAVELFESRGFRQVFAENVMCADLLAEEPFEAVWAEGSVVVEWGPEVAERFHAVYAAAFRERPGFPDPSAVEWIADTAGEDDFRADWSLLVSVPGIGDAGFVTAGDGWIVQVGVVPAARGLGLGAALIRESLRRAAGDGFTESWLCVNVDNPAAALYRRLGFRERGRRARFRPG